MLQSFQTMARNGSWTSVPKNRKSKAGVKKIPATLLITALHRAEATFPSADDVRITHMLTVVGRQVRISNPSKRGGDKTFGRNFLIARVKGRPTKKGQAAKVDSWIAVLSLMLEKASFSSDISRDRPESRKIKATPNFPINSSGLKRPPFFPSYDAEGELGACCFQQCNNMVPVDVLRGRAGQTKQQRSYPRGGSSSERRIEHW